MSAKFKASAIEQQDNVPLQWPRNKHVIEIRVKVKYGEKVEKVHNTARSAQREPPQTCA